MKKQWCIILFFFFTLCSCEDFLSWESKDLMIPQTVEQYNEIVAGDLIQPQLPIEFLSYMTDEIEDGVVGTANDSRANSYSGYYAWQKDPDIQSTGGIQRNVTWSDLYNRVFTCNMILDRLRQGRISGDKNALKILEAECLFFRAYFYFYIVNLYAPPYENEEQAKITMGVPLNKAVSMEDKMYKRSSLYEVYQYLIQDIMASVDIYSKYELEKISLYHPSYVVACHLAGRIYLYMHDYENAEKYIDEAIENTSATLFDLNTLDHTFIQRKNTEIMFTMGDRIIQYPFMSTYTQYTWKTSSKLLYAYNADDLRLKYFFRNDAVKQPAKYTSGSDVYFRNYRFSELLLNKAECLIARDAWREAIQVVNDIRRNRFKSGTDYTVSATDAVSALDVVKNERFIELCFEDVRWFDLRRWGMPRLVHKYHTSPTTTREFVLEEKSASYTLPLPLEVLNENDVIERWERQEQPLLFEE